MRYRNKLRKTGFFSVLLIAFFLISCSNVSNSTGKESNDEPPEESESVFTQIDQSEKTVQKIVGWLGEEDILVHLGDQENHQLVQINIKTGEKTILYDTSKYILTVEINDRLDKIVFQEGSDESVEMTLISTTGEELQRIPIDYAGYVTVDWNHADENLLFLSYYEFDQEAATETAKVMIWNLAENSLSDSTIQAIDPDWYSSHLYIYLNDETYELYIGDMRTEEEPQMINSNTIDYFLHQDTFISTSESDINENEMHLMKDYPLLVQQGVVTVPKLSMGDRVIQPYLSQSKRNGRVVGTIPDEAVDLNESLGTFTLSFLNFEEEEIEPIVPLPENAPIALSPDERYVLYGWQFEKVIDLQGNSTIHSLISESI